MYIKRRKNVYCAPPPPNFFVVPPVTGHYRKVQGTVTELADRTRPKRSLTFQSRYVKGDLASR